MKRALIFLGLSIFYLGVTAFSNPTGIWKKEFDQYQNHGELYFRFKSDKPSDLRIVTRLVSFDKTNDGLWFYAYANEKQFEKFASLHITYEVLKHPSTLIQPKMLQTYDRSQVLNWDFYPGYDLYLDMMNQFEVDFPGLCKVVNIGQSVEGRELLFVVISDNINIDEEEPQFMYTSSMHGDELTGYVLSLRLIDYLLNNYGVNPEVDELVNNMKIWINPLANPDGTYAGGNNTVTGSTRFNANYVDINRNFPDPDDGLHPDGEEYQAETMAFMALAEDEHFVMSANFHGGTEVFNYPWDTYVQLNADDNWWVYTGREWADTVHAHSPSGYFTDFNNGITNGYAWYSVAGGRQDYMNYYHHCREVTVELTAAKIIPASLLPNYWEYNYRSFLNYMKQALYGIQGMVKDSITGVGIEASVFVENHDNTNSWVSSYGEMGRYFRPIIGGIYDLTFFAPGYSPKTIPNISVANKSVTELNVQLVPTESETEEMIFKDQFRIGPNPFKERISIYYTSNTNEIFQIEVYQANGKNVFSKSAYGKDLNNGYVLDIPNSVSGLIYLKIYKGDQRQLWKLIQMTED